MDYDGLVTNLGKTFKGLERHKIALLGDSATQLLTKALRGYGYEMGYDFTVCEAGYNEIEAQVLSPDSELYQFRPEFVIVFYSVQKALLEFLSLEPRRRSSFARLLMERVERVYEALTRELKCKTIVLNFAEVDDGVFGHFANKTDESFLYQIRKVNLELMHASQKDSNLFVCDVCRLHGEGGALHSSDTRVYVNADVVFSIDFLPLVAKGITDIVSALLGKSKKCLVFDLDNTVWGGVIGDDGINNIEIGELGLGKAFTELQLWIRALGQRGIILAVCSKNDEKTALEPFQRHRDMVLRLQDIAIFIANWENKTDNIRHIQQRLNIGFDSMVFLDDNPAERSLVKACIPDITVPELPEDPADYLQYLRHLNLFEVAAITQEDRDRTHQYGQEERRRAAQKTYHNYDAYLEDLGMSSAVVAIDAYTIPRIAQLTQRTNQFNLRTRRYSEAELEAIMASDDHLILAFTLQDKFGDYGIVGAVIAERQMSTSLFIDTWVMSCRVFKRSLEHFTMNQLAREAERRGFHQIIGEYVQTAKNGVVKDLYSSLGFLQSEKDGSRFYLPVAGFQPRPTAVKLKSIE
jgi:FkbH-like protein